MTDEEMRQLGTALAADAIVIGEGDPRMAAIVLLNVAIGLLAGTPDKLPDWTQRTAAYVEHRALAAQAGGAE